MNTTSIGNVSYPAARGTHVGAARGSSVAARQPQVEETTPGLRRIASPRPNQAHAVLTYGITTIARDGGVGANIDIYV